MCLLQFLFCHDAILNSLCIICKTNLVVGRIFFLELIFISNSLKVFLICFCDVLKTLGVIKNLSESIYTNLLNDKADGVSSVLDSQPKVSRLWIGFKHGYDIICILPQTIVFAFHSVEFVIVFAQCSVEIIV